MTYDPIFCQIRTAMDSDLGPVSSPQVWDPHTNQNIKKVEAVQRCAARFIMNDGGKAPSQPK